MTIHGIVEYTERVVLSDYWSAGSAGFLALGELQADRHPAADELRLRPGHSSMLPDDGSSMIE